MHFSKMFRFLCLSFFLIVLGSKGSLAQYADFRAADSLAGANQWDKAGEIYKLLAETNLYNGYYWSSYAYSLYMQHDYKRSIETFLKAAGTGFDLAGDYYNIACCYSLMNEPEKALGWLDSAAIYKMTNLDKIMNKDSDLEAVRKSASFTQMFPGRSMFKTREEGWRADLQHYRRRMQQVHFSLFGRMDKVRWNRTIDSLEENCSELNDYQMLAGLFSLSSMVGDGHTRIFRPDNDFMKVKVLPLTFFLFEDGLYITSAAKGFGELTGKKVIKFGKYDTDKLMEILRRVSAYDNEFGFKSYSLRLMTFNGLMYGLGVTSSPDETEITIYGGRKITVKAEQLVNGDFSSEISPATWVKGRDTSITPLYQKEELSLFYKEYVPEHKTMYARFNGIHDTKEQKLSDFFAGVMDDAQTNGAENLVLDIRNNGGGDSYNNKYIVQSIVKNGKFNKKGHLFVIIGRVTFSAAVNLCGYLERETEALFVGEPTGSPPNFVGENNQIQLPYSGITASCSSRYWQNAISIDYRKWIEAELGVRYFYDDFRRGYDPAMEEIIKFIDNK